MALRPHLADCEVLRPHADKAPLLEANKPSARFFGGGFWPEAVLGYPLSSILSIGG